jgi:arylsulfatase A-like enzyme
LPGILFIFCTLTGCSTKDQKRGHEDLTERNLILITIDTLRADHLGCYGYPLGTTPGIDGMARAGVQFARCITPVPKTGPALASLLTSTLPARHLVFFNEQVIEESLPTLAENLSLTGIYCGGIQVNEICRKECGFDRGFNDYIQTTRPQPGHKPVQRIEDVNRQVLEWLDSHCHNRFFLWIHYIDPHGPYDPPGIYTRLFTKENYTVPVSSLEVIPEMKGLGGIPEYQAVIGSTDPRIYMARYDGEIRYVDHGLQDLMHELSGLGILSTTDVVLSADHGESLVEHNYFFEHGGFIYEQGLQVPLIFRLNDRSITPRIAEGQASLLDLAPTILEIAHAPALKNASGISLMPWIRNSSGNIQYTSVLLASSEPQLGEYGSRGMTDGKMKYIEYTNTDSQKKELFDLTVDPQETRNIIRDMSEEFQTKLSETVKKLSPDVPTGLREPKTSPRLLGKGNDMLKALGYIE